jgi:hypothetical protein
MDERLIILSDEEEAAIAEQELKDALDDLAGKTSELVPSTPVNPLQGVPSVRQPKPNRKTRRAMAKLSRKKNRKKK